MSSFVQDITREVLFNPDLEGWLRVYKIKKKERIFLAELST